jgi:hypothetical protein
MGDEVATTVFTREDRQRYRDKVKRNLDVFARMLRESRFDGDKRSIGLEIELNLTEETGDPALANTHVLELIADEDFQTELGQFNVEINIPPRKLAGKVFDDLEECVRADLNAAEQAAKGAHVHLLMIGIMPTLTPSLLNREALSANPRYALLNEQIFAARGEDLEISIDGAERLSIHADTIAPEAACTSVQLHQQVEPEAFARHWNAAQAIAGVQVAVAANSPFFYGKELWRETRIALFEQATDTRPEELKIQGVRPRVWFGERWITSIFDLFEENVRYFPALLPVCEAEDPLETLERGDVPRLAELRLHNGTIWRWNRPIYDVADGVPHLRVENRVLPAGPSVVDMIANAMFFYGLLRTLTEQDEPPWLRMPFSAAEQNFRVAARDGMAAQLYWPEADWLHPDELVLRRLLPMAAEGLANWGVTDEIAARYLDVIEQRCKRRCTGSSWQVHTVAALQRRGADRPTAIRGMLERYLDGMANNAPVHTWPLPA